MGTMNNFLEYVNNAGDAVQIIFNLKDFRAMLTLCEALDCDVRLLFQGAGHPLLVEAHFGATPTQVHLSALPSSPAIVCFA